MGRAEGYSLFRERISLLRRSKIPWLAIAPHFLDDEQPHTGHDLPRAWDARHGVFL